MLPTFASSATLSLLLTSTTFPRSLALSLPLMLLITPQSDFCSDLLESGEVTTTSTKLQPVDLLTTLLHHLEYGMLSLTQSIPFSTFAYSCTFLSKFPNNGLISQETTPKILPSNSLNKNFALKETEKMPWLKSSRCTSHQQLLSVVPSSLPCALLVTSLEFADQVLELS